MAHAWSITDGTTTVSLSTTNFIMRQHVPQPPTWRNGGYSNVTEVLDVAVTAASAALAQAALNSVETLIHAAIRRQQTGAGARVYLQLTLDGGSAYRSEVLSGRIDLDDMALRGLGQALVECTIYLERVHFWEGAEATLASAESITNDGSNVVTLSTVAGVIPAPAIIGIANDTGTTLAWRDFFIGNDAYSGFTGTQHQVSGAGSVTWGGGGAALTTVQEAVAIADAVIAKCAGRRFRLLGAFASSPNEIWMQAKLAVNIGGIRNYLDVADPVWANNAELIDFGSLRIPPGGNIATTDVECTIHAYDADAGGYNSTRWQLTPAEPGEYMHLAQEGYTIADGDAVWFDGVADEAYLLSGSDRWPIAVRRAGGLMVFPGRTNNVMVLISDTSGYTAARALTVTVKYRPRRLTI